MACVALWVDSTINHLIQPMVTLTSDGGFWRSATAPPLSSYPRARLSPPPWTTIVSFVFEHKLSNVIRKSRLYIRDFNSWQHETKCWSHLILPSSSSSVGSISSQPSGGGFLFWRRTWAFNLNLMFDKDCKTFYVSFFSLRLCTIYDVNYINSWHSKLFKIQHLLWIYRFWKPTHLWHCSCVCQISFHSQSWQDQNIWNLIIGFVTAHIIPHT